MILVLEDDRLRVKWLRRVATCPIVHVETVEDFLEFYEENKDKLKLIILDHDLGQMQSGYDAAKRIDSGVPVVVWSVNPVGAENITKALRANRVQCLHLPFIGINNKQLIEIIESIS